MSKKYKSQTRKAAGNGSANNPASTTAATSRAQSASQTTFNPDYAYVVKDLRRIGLLAGTFISILVILTFFLR
jgi:hypothetical protein